MTSKTYHYNCEEYCKGQQNVVGRATYLPPPVNVKVGLPQKLPKCWCVKPDNEYGVWATLRVQDAARLPFPSYSHCPSLARQCGQWHTEHTTQRGSVGVHHAHAAGPRSQVRFRREASRCVLGPDGSEPYHFLSILSLISLPPHVKSPALPHLVLVPRPHYPPPLARLFQLVTLIPISKPMPT